MPSRIVGLAAALLCTLLIALANWAQSAVMWSTEMLNYPSSDAFSIGVYGPYQSLASPSSLLFGTVPSGPVSEVVVEQHILRPGETVPLPHYADGTEARESEVFWTAHVWQAKFDHFRSPRLFPAFPGSAGDLVTIGFSGRTFGGGSAVLDPHSYPLQTAYEVDAVVTVVAARAITSVPAAQPTWGQVKAKYATPAPAVTR